MSPGAEAPQNVRTRPVIGQRLYTWCHALLTAYFSCVIQRSSKSYYHFIVTTDASQFPYLVIVVRTRRGDHPLWSSSCTKQGLLLLAFGLSLVLYEDNDDQFIAAESAAPPALRVKCTNCGVEKQLRIRENDDGV